MDSSYQHRILIVDDNDNTVEIFNNILADTHIEKFCTISGEAALELIKNQEQPFSFIICEQNLAGMKGTQFFEHVREICPHSILCLMADHPDINEIILVVNKGIIQHYITKPIDPDELLAAVKLSIKKFETLQDNERLLRLAKHQNTKLYDLNCELMETTKTHNKTIHDLDKKIEQLKKDIQNISDRPIVKPDLLSPEIKNHIMDGADVTPENIHSLFSESIQELHNRFSELAYRNGFEMPPITNGEK